MSASLFRSAARNEGMTLLETLAYIAGLAIFINICAVAFIQGNRLMQVGETALLRMNAASEIQRDFTQAVREAVSVDAERSGFVSNSAQVVLRMPSNPNDPNTLSFVLFGNSENGSLFMNRYILRDGALELDRSKLYPVPYESAEITYDRSPSQGARTVHLNLRLFADRPDNRSGGGLQCVASIRSSGGAV